MAKVILTLKIMPESPEVDLEKVQAACNEAAKAQGTEVGKVEVEPFAFGLKILKLYFVLDEEGGSPDALEEALKAVEGVQSVETIDVRRTLG